MVEFGFFGDSVQIGSHSSRDGALEMFHGVIIDEGIKNPAERAVAGLGGCWNESLRAIVATRSDRQIARKIGIGPRDTWAPCGAALICIFIMYAMFSRRGGEPAI